MQRKKRFGRGDIIRINDSGSFENSFAPSMIDYIGCYAVIKENDTQYETHPYRLAPCGIEPDVDSHIDGWVWKDEWLDPYEEIDVRNVNLSGMEELL